MYVQFSDEELKRDFVALVWRPLAEVLDECRAGRGQKSGGVANSITSPISSMRYSARCSKRNGSGKISRGEMHG